MTYNIIALTILHILISLIYLAFMLKRKSLQQSVYRFVVVLFLPGLGILFFILSGIFSRVVKGSENIENSYQKYVRDDSHIEYVHKIDFNKEVNIVPLSDSLTLSTVQQRRAFLVDLLKKDYSRYIKVLRRAVSNEDSETSHYAGAALMEIKKQFEGLLYEKNRQYESDRANIKKLRENIETIKKYINSGLPDEVEKKEFSINLSFLLEKYLEKDRYRKQFFTDKINLDLELGNIKEAERTCKEFYRYFSHDQAPYFMLLKFFFSTNNIKSLRKVIGHIKKKKFNLSEKNRQLLYFWERQTGIVL